MDKLMITDSNIPATAIVRYSGMSAYADIKMMVFALGVLAATLCFGGCSSGQQLNTLVTPEQEEEQDRNVCSASHVGAERSSGSGERNPGEQNFLEVCTALHSSNGSVYAYAWAKANVFRMWGESEAERIRQR